MTILTNIKQEQLRARKDRDTVKATLLTTLIGEAVMVGKNDGNRETNDAEVVRVIKKFITNAKETLLVIKDSDRLEDIKKVTIEIDTLHAFLPQQLTGTQLADVIDKIISATASNSLKDMGKIMKALKEQYSGKYDGAEANALIKARFS